jgi:hypothetical protein
MRKVYCTCGSIVDLDCDYFYRRMNLGKQVECIRCRNERVSREIDELNTSVEKEVASLSSDAQTSRPENDKPLRTAKAASLVAVSDGHDRSFRVCVMPPEGRSYAEDIAVKYGVTFDLLTKE